MLKDFKRLSKEDVVVQTAYIKTVSRFFKSKYQAENDVLVGLRMPQIRSFVKNHYNTIDRDGVKSILEDHRHELWISAVLFLVSIYERPSQTEEAEEKDVRSSILNFYLANAVNINNWDIIEGKKDCFRIHAENSP